MGKENFKDKKILVVDDEVALRRAIKSVLETNGFQVKEAENGLVAKKILESETFHAIVSDVRMPLFNGIELLQFVKKTNPIPFIIMTGFSDILEAKEAFGSGADQFVAKPFKRADLLQALEKCFNSESPSEGELKLKKAQ